MANQEFNFENAEGAETRTRKLNLLETEVDNLQLNDNINYSFTEQDTGIKSTSGASIFRKTIAIGTPATGEQSVAHGITGIGAILKTEGYVTQANAVTSVLPRLSAGTPLVDSIFFARHDATNLYGYVGTGFTTGTAITGGQITITYTKV